MSAVAELPRSLKGVAYWLDYQLANWARWKQSGGMPAGLPSGSAEGCASYHSDFDDMCAAMDRRNAATVDIVVMDLGRSRPAERCALEHAYQGAPWRFPQENLDELLVSAKAYVERELRRRGVWMGE